MSCKLGTAQMLYIFVCVDACTHGILLVVVVDSIVVHSSIVLYTSCLVYDASWHKLNIPAIVF